MNHIVKKKKAVMTTLLSRFKYIYLYNKGNKPGTQPPIIFRFLYVNTKLFKRINHHIIFTLLLIN